MKVLLHQLLDGSLDQLVVYEVAVVIGAEPLEKVETGLGLELKRELVAETLLELAHREEPIFVRVELPD